MLLADKVAVVYGAGGAVGSAVARGFAREGARVFLAGRTRKKLQRTFEEIASAGGRAEVDELDVLDRSAVDAHMAWLVGTAGRVDVSFNLINYGEAMGAPLFELPLEKFVEPIHTAMRAQFFTMSAAVRRMAAQGSGVILALTANVARVALANCGGFSVACAAIEGMCRQLAVDAGPRGVRVVCLRSAGSPDAEGVREAFRLHAKNSGRTFEEFVSFASEGTLLKKLPMLEEVIQAAVFLASDRASAMTAAVANLTCGWVQD